MPHLSFAAGVSALDFWHHRAVQGDEDSTVLRARVATLERELAARPVAASGRSPRVVVLVVVLLVVGLALGFSIGRQQGLDGEAEARDVARRAWSDATASVNEAAAAREELLACTSGRPSWAGPLPDDLDPRSTPLVPECPTRHRRYYDARVTQASGASRIESGQACRVELEWTRGDPNCRSHVDCGERRLYGDVGLGFFPCTIDSNGIRSGSDDAATASDGDATLRYDRHSGELVVGDTAPTWSATLELGAWQSAEP